MASDICLPVQVAAISDGWTVNDMSMVLGFFIGVLVGAIVAVLCAKLCARDLNRVSTKQQDVEGAVFVTHHNGTGFGGQQNFKQGKKASKKKKSIKRRRGIFKKGDADTEDEPLLPITIVSPLTPLGNGSGNSEEGGEEDAHNGLIDALLHDSMVDMEEQVSEQEINALSSLDKDLKEESIMTMIQMMRTMLGKQLAKGKLTPEQSQGLMKKMQEDIEDEILKAQREREEAEEELKKKKFRDPAEREREQERIRSMFMHRLNSIVPEEKNLIRKQLSCQTDLSEIEIDAMLAEMTQNMANLEQKLGDERMRQTAAIEERLAKRRLLLEKRTNESQQHQNEIALRLDANHTVISTLVDDGKLLGRQKDELLAQYKDDMERLHKTRQEELQRQKLALAEKLKKNREEKMKRLEKEQEKEQENFVRKADKIQDTSDLVESYHDLLQQQRTQQNDMIDALDYEEAGQIDRITQEQNKVLEQGMEEAETEFQKKLHLKAQLSESESSRVMKLHKQQMQEVEKLKKAEKKRMKAKLEERLAERRKKTEEDQQKMMMEQEVLKEQQDATIGKLLSSQHELNDEAKNQILKEHEQNMAAINNHLQSSKLRQQKLLEQKLNKRRAKLEDLKRKGEDAKMLNKHVKDKGKEKEQQQLEQMIAAEEKSLQEEKKRVAKELRERTTEETERLLKEQDKRIGLLIARLQVGQARRQTTIQKQDKTIKELETQLANRVVESTDGKSDNQVNSVLKKHYNQMTEVSEKMEAERDHQQQILQEKIQAKKQQKERQIEDRLETDAQVEWEQQKKRGAGLATSILSQSMLEQRHKMAMLQLEKEMQGEMQKQREILNRELEEELQHELSEHKKNFLSQLAAISKMSKEEVNRLVSDVVTDSGGSNKEAKKLAKELKTGMEHARTDMAIDEDEEDDDSYSGYDEVDDSKRTRGKRRR